MIKKSINFFLRKTIIFQVVKYMLFPGLDLHTRCRYKNIPKHFLKGNITTLDAGCGNACLAYAAYKNGNKAVGVSFEDALIERNRVFYNFLNIKSDRLSFKTMNLYDIEKFGDKFDQIICSETLEHISDDKHIIRAFYNILNTNGVLHLCCPYLLHPQNHLGRINMPEDGNHVRDGYTHESYKELLEPLGFKIIEYVGIGSPIVVKLDNFVRFITNTFGELFSIPFLLLVLPFTFFDKVNPKVPFSLYVKCVKK